MVVGVGAVGGSGLDSTWDKASGVVLEQLKCHAGMINGRSLRSDGWV